MNEQTLKLVRAYAKNPSSVNTYTRLSTHLQKMYPELNEEQVQELIDGLGDNHNIQQPVLTSASTLLNKDAEQAVLDVKDKIHSKLGAPNKRDNALWYVIDKERHRLPLALKYIQGAVKDVQPEVEHLANVLKAVVHRMYNTSNLATKQEGSVTDLTRSHLTGVMLMLNFQTKIDPDVLTAIDFGSLVRLSMLCGGQSIQVPTWDELEHSIATVYYQYLIQYKQLSSVRAIKTVEKDLGIKIKDKTRLNKDCGVLLKMLSTELDTPSSPVVSQFSSVLKQLQSIQERLEQSIEQVKDPATILELYKEVNCNILNITESILGVGSSLGGQHGQT